MPTDAATPSLPAPRPFAGGELLLLDHPQVLPGRFHFPARATAVRTDAGVVLVSPVPLDATRRAALDALGEVRYLVAPNLLHHLYLGDAIAAYPGATVLAPRGLRRKRPDLRIDRDLEDGLPEPLAAALTALPFRGAPAFDEFVFFHAATRTLVVTDLVFHVERPEGLVAHLTLWLVGCHGRLGQSRALRFLVRDHAAASASLEAIFDLPFERLVMAHGTPIEADARARFLAAVASRRKATPALPAGG